MRNQFLPLLFAFVLVGCQQEKPKAPADPRKAAIKDKLLDATTKGIMQHTLTIEQMLYLHRKLDKTQNLDSLEMWVDSIAPLLVKGQHAIGGPAQLVCTWVGYEGNVLVKTFNTDSIYSEERIMDYCKKFESQTKKYQNTYLCFFMGNAPSKMPVPRFQQIDPDNPKKTGSHAVFLYMKTKKPYASVIITGEREFEYNKGFTF